MGIGIFKPSQSNQDRINLLHSQQRRQYTGSGCLCFKSNVVLPRQYLNQMQQQLSARKQQNIFSYNELKEKIKKKLSLLERQQYKDIDIEYQVELIQKGARTDLKRQIDKQQIKLHATFLFQTAKYYYFQKKYSRTKDLLRQLLESQDSLKICNFEKINLMLFSLFCTYLVKEQSGATTAKDYIELLQLNSEIDKLLPGPLQICTHQQILVVVHSLIYHFKQKCKTKMLQLQSRQRREEQIKLSRIYNDQQKLLPEKDILLRAALLKFKNLPKSVTFQIALHQKKISKNQEQWLSTENNKIIYKRQKIKQLEKTLKEINIDFQSLSSIVTKKDAYFFQESDVKAIFQNCQQAAKGKKIQLPFFNLKAVYISPTASQNWLAIYKNKTFAAFDIRLLYMLWPVSTGVFLNFDTTPQTNESTEVVLTVSQQSNRRNLILTDNNTKNPSLQQTPNKITDIKIKRGLQSDQVSHKAMNDNSSIKKREEQHKTAQFNLVFGQNSEKAQKTQNKLALPGKSQPSSSSNAFSYPRKAKEEENMSQSNLQYKSYIYENKSLQPQRSVIKYPDNKKPQFENQSRGLQNLGNTCYMNSALQCLHKSKAFNEAFHQAYDRLPASQKRQRSLSCSYKEMIDELSNSKQYLPYSPHQIKQVVSDSNILFKDYRQNDAVEFLSTFLEKMSEQLNTSGEKPIQGEFDQRLSDQQMYEKQKRKNESRRKSIVEETIAGMYKTSYRCCQPNCNSKFKLFQKFKVHYVPIPQPDHSSYWPTRYYHKQIEYQLEKCLQDFQIKDNLSGTNAFPCDRCHKDTTTAKTMQVYQANKIVIISLKRFHNNKKNDRQIKIPKKIAPSSFVMNHSNQMYQGKIYRLYAAIIHRGSINGGHYTAVCKDKKQWKSYNDSYVSSISETQLDYELRSAYAIFYELF